MGKLVELGVTEAIARTVEKLEDTDGLSLVAFCEGLTIGRAMPRAVG